MRRRLSSRKGNAGLNTLLLAGSLAFSCATPLKKNPVRTAKPEIDTIDVPIMVSRKERTTGRQSRKAPAKAMKRITRVLRVGDKVALWPGEGIIKVTKITPTEIWFSEGTKLQCGESYHYIDIRLIVTVSRMDPADRSVTIAVEPEVRR